MTSSFPVLSTCRQSSRALALKVDFETNCSTWTSSVTIVIAHLGDDDKLPPSVPPQNGTMKGGRFMSMLDLTLKAVVLVVLPVAAFGIGGWGLTKLSGRGDSKSQKPSCEIACPEALQPL